MLTIRSEWSCDLCGGGVGWGSGVKDGWLSPLIARRRRLCTVKNICVLAAIQKNKKLCRVKMQLNRIKIIQYELPLKLRFYS